MERHISPAAGGFVAHVFSLHDVDEVERLITGAGFSNVNVEAAAHDLKLPAPRQFLWQYIHSTPLSAVVSQADPTKMAELEREVLAAWADAVRGDVLTQSVRLVIASATKDAG